MKENLQAPKWLRSRYQLKKEIKRRFIENMTTEYLKILLNKEVKIIFGESHKTPIGILNYNFDKDLK